MTAQNYFVHVAEIFMHFVKRAKQCYFPHFNTNFHPNVQIFSQIFLFTLRFLVCACILDTQDPILCSHDLWLYDVAIPTRSSRAVRSVIINNNNMGLASSDKFIVADITSKMADLGSIIGIKLLKIQVVSVGQTHMGVVRPRPKSAILEIFELWYVSCIDF